MAFRHMSLDKYRNALRALQKQRTLIEQRRKNVYDSYFYSRRDHDAVEERDHFMERCDREELEIQAEVRKLRRLALPW